MAHCVARFSQIQLSVFIYYFPWVSKHKTYIYLQLFPNVSVKQEQMYICKTHICDILTVLCVAGVLMFMPSTVLNSDGLRVVATQQKPNE